MEEKQEKKQPEFKGKVGIIWLTGILVIILGCVTVYTFKLVNENKKLKQIPPEPQAVAKVEETKEEPSKTESTTSEEKAETTNSTTTEKTTYTFNDLEGVYEGTETIKVDGKNVKEYFSLDLYKDGTYQYQESNELAAPSGSIGNYIIDGNKIVLNSWFITGSDVSLGVKNEKETYTISKDAIGKMKKTNKKFENLNVMQLLKANASYETIYVAE